MSTWGSCWHSFYQCWCIVTCYSWMKVNASANMVTMAKKIRWNSPLTLILIVSFSALLLNVCSSFGIVFNWSFYWDLLTRFYLRVAAESNKSRGLMYCHLLTCPSYFIPGDCRLLWHFLWQRLQHQGKQQRQQPGHLTETQLRSHFSVFPLPKAAASNQRTSFPTADISIYPAEAAVWNSPSQALRATPICLFDFTSPQYLRL